MIKAVTIDDEANGRKTIVNFVKQHSKFIEVVGEAHGVFTGLKLIEEKKPDLVFLDIQMDDGTGFDLLERIPNINFWVVFVTAYDQFALKAFKFSAVDYLLKPINPLHILDLEKKLESLQNPHTNKEQLLLLNQNNDKPERIALPTFDGIKMAYVNDIIRCQSDNNYTEFYFKNGEKLVVSKTIKEYEELFEDSFFRVHNSHLVNLKYVDQYLKEDGGKVQMHDGTRILISRRRKNDFLEKLMG